MNLIEVMEMYKIQMNNPNADIWGDVQVHHLIDKEAMINHILLEYGGMEIIEFDSRTYKLRIDNFFKIHKWNIDKLAESLNFYYNPIGNVNFHVHDKWTRDEQIDNTWNRDEQIDFESDRTMNNNKHQTDDTRYHENGSSSGVDTNFVSAFNDIESRENNIVDTEHDRTTHSARYEKDGTENLTRDIREDEGEGITTGQTEGESKVEQQIEDEGKDETIDKYGHEAGQSFQELIEEERQQAQFNIYHWIGNKFANECLVTVWD